MSNDYECPVRSVIPRPRYCPLPNGNADQVHQFLVHFLLSQGVAQESASAEASKLDIDGKELHRLPREAWLELYGLKGKKIYDHVKFYRVVSLSRLSHGLSLFLSSFWSFSGIHSSFTNC